MAARLGVAFAGSECYGYAKPFIYLQQPCIVSQSTSICACQKSPRPYHKAGKVQPLHCYIYPMEDFWQGGQVPGIALHHMINRRVPS